MLGPFNYSTISCLLSFPATQLTLKSIQIKQCPELRKLAADKPPFSLIASLQGHRRTSISLLRYVAGTIDELFCASAFIRGNFGTDIFL
ncbi:MAG TPA: hypothetical protein VD811_16180 [Desulfuromonadales bacterium]|nr:hypothetical protein [Desulfuromonadales bacterium]